MEAHARLHSGLRSAQAGGSDALRVRCNHPLRGRCYCTEICPRAGAVSRCCVLELGHPHGSRAAVGFSAGRQAWRGLALPAVKTDSGSENKIYARSKKMAESVLHIYDWDGSGDEIFRGILLDECGFIIGSFWFGNWEVDGSTVILQSACLSARGILHNTRVRVCTVAGLARLNAVR